MAACFLNAPVQAAPTKIPADAIEWRGHSYYVYPSRFATWEEAKHFCESLGGHMAIINDAAENKCLFDYIRSRGIKSAYFGLSDSVREGSWKWVDGTSLTYSNRHIGEPSNGNKADKPENYGMFYWQFTDGTWNDGDFTDYGTDSGGSAFICEWESSKQNASSGQAVNRVTVEGTGANRDSAIRDAARNAVEQVVGVYIDSRSLTRNSKLALDEIYAKSQGYVKNVTVIDENYSDGNCNVTANIEVDNNPDGQLITSLSGVVDSYGTDYLVLGKSNVDDLKPRLQKPPKSWKKNLRS